MAPLCLHIEEIVTEKVQGFWVLSGKSEKLLKVRYGTKFMGENYRKLKFCRK